MKKEKLENFNNDLFHAFMEYQLQMDIVDFNDLKSSMVENELISNTELESIGINTGEDLRLYCIKIGLIKKDFKNYK